MAVIDKTTADAAYIAGLSYESDATGATAQNFLAAIRFYIRDGAKSYSVGGRMLTHYELMEQEKQAQAFVLASPANKARVNMFTRGRTTGLGI